MRGKNNPHNLNSFFGKSNTSSTNTSTVRDSHNNNSTNSYAYSYFEPFDDSVNGGPASVGAFGSSPSDSAFPSANRFQPTGNVHSTSGNTSDSERRQTAPNRFTPAAVPAQESTTRQRKEFFPTVKDDEPPKKVKKEEGKDNHNNSNNTDSAKKARAESTHPHTALPLPAFNFLEETPPPLPGTTANDTIGSSQYGPYDYHWGPFDRNQDIRSLDEDEERDEEDQVVGNFKRRQKEEKKKRLLEEQQKPEKAKESTTKRLLNKASSFFFGSSSKDAARHAVSGMLKPGGGGRESGDEDEEDPRLKRRLSSVMRSFRFGKSAATFHEVGDQEEEDDDDDEEVEDHTAEQLELLEQSRLRGDGNLLRIASIPMFESPNTSPEESLRENNPLGGYANSSMYGAPELTGVEDSSGRRQSYSKRSVSRFNTSLNSSTVEGSRLKRSQSRKQSRYNLSTRDLSAHGRSKSSANMAGGAKVTVDLEADMDVDALIDEATIQESEIEMYEGELEAGRVPSSIRPVDEDFTPIIWTTRQFQHNLARAVIAQDHTRFWQLLLLYSMLKRQQEFADTHTLPFPLKIVLVTETDKVVCKQISEKHRRQEAHTYNCPSILDQVFDPDTGYTLMHLCVLAKKHNIIQECLRFGTQPHEVRDLQGDTPLTLAMKRFPTAAPVLFSLGRDIDTTRPCGPWSHTGVEDDDELGIEGTVQSQNLVFCCVDADDKTPDWPGRLTFIRFLVEKQGIRASQEDYLGFTPALWAVQHAEYLGKKSQSKEIIKYLKKKANEERTADVLLQYSVDKDNLEEDDDEIIAPDLIQDPRDPKPATDRAAPPPVAPSSKDDSVIDKPNILRKRMSITTNNLMPKVQYSPSSLALAEALSVEPSTRRPSKATKSKEVPRMPLFFSSVDTVRRFLQGPTARLIAIALLFIFHVLEYALFTTQESYPHISLEVWAKAVGIIGCNWAGLPFFLGMIRCGFIIAGATIGCLVFYYVVARLIGAKLLKLPAFGAQSEQEQLYYSNLYGPYMAKVYDPRTRSRLFCVPVGIIIGLYCGALAFNAVCSNAWESQAGWALLSPSIGNIHPDISVFILMAITLGFDWYVFIFICDLMYQQGALSVHLPHFTFDSFANGVDVNMRRLLFGPLPNFIDTKKDRVSIVKVKDGDEEDPELLYIRKVDNAREKEIQTQLNQLRDMRQTPVMDIESFRLYAFWIAVLTGWLILTVAFILVGVLRYRDYDQFYYADYQVQLNEVKADACVLFASFAILLLCIIPLQEWSWPTFQKTPYLSLPGMTGSTHHAWFLLLVLFTLFITDLQNIIEHVKMVWAISDSQSAKISAVCCTIPAWVGLILFIVSLLATSLRWVKPPPKPRFAMEDPKHYPSLFTRVWRSCAYGAHLHSIAVPNVIGLLRYHLPHLPEWKALREEQHQFFNTDTTPDKTQTRTYDENLMPGEKPILRSVAVRHIPRHRRKIAVVRIVDLLNKNRLLAPLKELTDNGRSWSLDENSDGEMEEENEYWNSIAKAQNEKIRSNFRKAINTHRQEQGEYNNPFADKGKDAKKDKKGKKRQAEGMEEEELKKNKKNKKEIGAEDVIVTVNEDEKSNKKKKPTTTHEAPTSLFDRMDAKANDNNSKNNNNNNKKTLDDEDVDFNKLFRVRVIVQRRRRLMRERQQLYQTELLAFIGDTSQARRQVMNFRKKENKYMRAVDLQKQSKVNKKSGKAINNNKNNNNNNSDAAAGDKNKKNNNEKNNTNTKDKKNNKK